MIISNYNKKTIRIQSEYLERLINSSSPDINICITGKICNCENSFSQSITLADFWSIDLDAEVDSKMTIDNIIFKNTKTDKEFSIPISIKLSSQEGLLYLSTTSVIINGSTGKVNTPVTVIAKLPWTITDEYTEEPTQEDTDGENLLEDLSVVLQLIKAKIDSYFISLGITSNITVFAEGNNLKLKDFPEDFLPVSMSFEDTEEIKNFCYGLEKDVNLIGNILEIKPSFFGFTNLLDGVYSFELIGYDGTEYFREKNCAFIDIETEKLVAIALNNLVGESRVFLLDKENKATYIHLLHYGLTIGSNQKCNCSDLITAYKELSLLLESYKTTSNGCGC